MLPLRSVGWSNFDKGRHNSNNYVDSKSTYNYNELLYYIMKSTVDKVNYLNTLSKNSMSRICPQEGKCSEVSLKR